MTGQVARLGTEVFNHPQSHTIWSISSSTSASNLKYSVYPNIIPQEIHPRKWWIRHSWSLQTRSVLLENCLPRVVKKLLVPLSASQVQSARTIMPLLMGSALQVMLRWQVVHLDQRPRRSPYPNETRRNSLARLNHNSKPHGPAIQTDPIQTRRRYPLPWDFELIATNACARFPATTAILSAIDILCPICDYLTCNDPSFTNMRIFWWYLFYRHDLTCWVPLNPIYPWKPRFRDITKLQSS